MKNLNYKVFSVIAACFAALIFGSSGYAGVETEEVSIDCPTCSPSQWTTFRGRPNLQYTLTTKGMQVPGKHELVTNWFEYVLEDMSHPDAAGVVAVCGQVVLGNSRDKGVYMMDEEDVSSKSPLVCEKGQSLSVKVLLPECQGGEYKYIGTLVKITDDEEKEEIMSYTSKSKSMNNTDSLGSSDGLPNGNVGIEGGNISGKKVVKCCVM
jgi:hypothetical protein